MIEILNDSELARTTKTHDLRQSHIQELLPKSETTSNHYIILYYIYRKIAVNPTRIQQNLIASKIKPEKRSLHVCYGTKISKETTKQRERERQRTKNHQKLGKFSWYLVELSWDLSRSRPAIFRLRNYYKGIHR